MKKLLIPLLLLPTVAMAFTVPTRPTGFVQDYAKMLTSEQVSTLEAKLENYERQSTNEIAVVTIPSLDGDTIENVAQNIFTKWGIGKKDKNNGVLLLISLSDRKTRIHTGYGVEGDLTDIGTSYIQSDIIAPAFRQGDYYGGINGAVDKMISALGGTEIVPENYSKSNSGVLQFIIFFSIFAFQIITSILARSKSWWGGGIVGGVVGFVVAWALGLALFFGGILLIFFVLLGLLLDFLVSRSYERYKKSGSRGWWFFTGGGGGFGSGGGGFGGFGGGGSGGGGSSGGW